MRNGNYMGNTVFQISTSGKDTTLGKILEVKTHYWDFMIVL